MGPRPGGPVGGPPNEARGQVSGRIAVAALILCFPLGFVLVLFTNWSTRTKTIIDGTIIAVVVAFGIYNTVLLQAAK